MLTITVINYIILYDILYIYIYYTIYYIYIYIYIYITIYITICVDQLDNVSDTQAVGRESMPRPEHLNSSQYNI